MSRDRPQSLNLGTPIGGAYGSTPYYSPVRRSSSKTRFCNRCSSAFHQPVPSPMMPSPAYYPVPYMVPVMCAPRPAPIAPVLPPPPLAYKEPLQLPEPPYPIYETDETDYGEMGDRGGTAEETLSTLQRNTLRKSNYMSNSMIRDFEETKWIPIDDTSKDVENWMIKRDRWFQNSVELPDGVITKLCCEKEPSAANENSTLTKNSVRRLRINGRIRRWSPDLRAIVEDDFTQMLILPQDTNINSISYKLQTKTIQGYNEHYFNSTLRHHSTSYDNDREEPLLIENTVVVMGQMDPVRLQRAVPPARLWSKEYKHTVRGTVDLSPDGRVINPVISSFSEMPDDIANLASTPDQDTSYTMIDGGMEVRIRLDDNVDRNSIELEVDPIKETLRAIFARHSRDRNSGSESGDNQVTTTNYDMQVDQTFKLSPRKFDINGISKQVRGHDLLLFIPFAKGFHPQNIDN